MMTTSYPSSRPLMLNQTEQGTTSSDLLRIVSGRIWVLRIGEFGGARPRSRIRSEFGGKVERMREAEGG
jgi:hypothetical protein